MKKIALNQLTNEEIGELEFAIAALITFNDITESDRAFIYNNIFRDVDGIAYAHLDAENRESLQPIINPS